MDPGSWVWPLSVRLRLSNSCTEYLKCRIQIESPSPYLSTKYRLGPVLKETLLILVVQLDYEYVKLTFFFFQKKKEEKKYVKTNTEGIFLPESVLPTVSNFSLRSPHQGTVPMEPEVEPREIAHYQLSPLVVS